MSEKQWNEIEARFAGPLKLARRPVCVTVTFLNARSRRAWRNLPEPSLQAAASGDWQLRRARVLYRSRGSFQLRCGRLYA